MTFPGHDTTAPNCRYNGGDQWDTEADCRACPMLDTPDDEPGDPGIAVIRRADGTTERFAETADPVAFERQFEDQREQIRARFTPIQMTQNQRLQIESVSDDFATLALRIVNEVTNANERVEALRHLELAYLMTLRGLTYG